MKTAIKTYGFEYRTLLGQLQHLCQWTRLDIQTAVQRLAQYQNAPGMLHFEGLLQIAKYLRRYPDLPLTFNRNIPRGSVISIAHISQAAPWLGEPTVISVEAHQFDKEQTFWHIPSKLTTSGVIETHHVNAITLPHLLQEQKHFSGVKTSQGLAPITTGFADANFGGAVLTVLPILAE